MTKDRPNWDTIFMFQAYVVATRSSCLHLSTGAIIVKDKRVIASGYNGAPPGIQNCLDVGCRKDQYHIGFDDKGKGVCRGTHAEINALSQIARRDLDGSILYSLYYPCSACAKAIVGNRIEEVIYSKIYNEPDSLTNELFSEAGIKLRKLDIDLENCFDLIRKLK